MPNGVFVKSFRRAAARLGGVGELAIYLQTSVEDVERWLRGTTRPPVSAFLRVVDVIMSNDGSPTHTGADAARPRRSVR